MWKLFSAMRLLSLVNRLREPSTWAGIAGLGMLFGNAEIAALGTPEVAVGITALLAVFLPERGKRE